MEQLLAAGDMELEAANDNDSDMLLAEMQHHLRLGVTRPVEFH